MHAFGLTIVEDTSCLRNNYHRSTILRFAVTIRGIHNGGVWSPRSTITSEFCLSVLATVALLSMFSDYEQLKTVFYGAFLCNNVQNSETYYLIQKSGGGGSAPGS